MTHLKKVFTLLILITFVKSEQDNNNNNNDNGNHQFILDSLRLKDYDINERPQARDNSPVQINASIYVQNLEWKHNEMTATMFFTQKWVDDRLTFNGDSPILVRFHQLKNKIWIPDTFVIEATSKEITEYGTIKIFPNGRVTWLQTMSLFIPCSFGFDEAWENNGIVQCTMDMESYGFTTNGISYGWIERDPVAVSSSTLNKPYAKFDSWESDLKIIEVPPAGNYGRLSAKFKFATVYTKEVLRFLGTRAMQNY